MFILFYFGFYKTSSVESCDKNVHNDSSSYEESGEEDIFKNSELSLNKILKADTWTCAHSSKEQTINHNKLLTDKLEDILSIYETTNDKFRALSYQKAILALKRCPYQIRTKEV